MFPLGKCYPEQEYNFVEIDSPSGGYLATKYLLSLGHRRIGFITEPARFLAPAKESMIMGCMKAYAEEGLEFPPPPGLGRGLHRELCRAGNRVVSQ